MSKKKMPISEEIQYAVSTGRQGAVMIVPERFEPAGEGMPPQVLWWLTTESRKFQVVALVLLLTINGITSAWDLSILPYSIGLMQRNFEKRADVFALWDAEGRAIAVPSPGIGMELTAVCARTVKEGGFVPLAIRGSFKEQPIPAGTSLWDLYEDPTTGIVDLKKDPRTVRLWQEELWATQEAVRNLLDAERAKGLATVAKPKPTQKENVENEEAEGK